MMRKSLVIPVLILAAAVSTTAIGAATMSSPTRENMLAAMKDEAFSHLRYKLFAEQARKNGNVPLAELFEKIGGVEFDRHFKEQAGLLGLVGSDGQNLAAAISDEYLETMKMYTEMSKRAGAAGDGTAARHFAAAAEDEREHHKAFKAMLAKKGGGTSN